MTLRRLIILTSVILATLFAVPGTTHAAAQVKLSAFGDSGLYVYIRASMDTGVPLTMLAGIDLYEGRDLANPDISHVNALAASLSERNGQSERNQLKAYTTSSSKRTKIQEHIARLNTVKMIVSDKRFPLDWNTGYIYEDNWNTPRGNAAERSHEGIDIMVAHGTEIKSVGAGRVEKIGWNTLGGWRVGIRGNDGIYYYYAHLSAYATGLKAGASIKQGQIIGYVGSSGYGPEGTTGLMMPHLHFGMYEAGMKAVNPYALLKLW